MKITPGESPGANERTIRTAGTNRLQHRIRFMEDLNHDTKIINIPNNRPLCRIKSRMQDRNNSVTQLIRYMKNSFRQPAPGCNRKRTKRCGISSCRSPDRRAAPPVLMESTPANGTATPGDRRPPDNTFALQQIARDIAPGLKSVYMPSAPAPPKKARAQVQFLLDGLAMPWSKIALTPKPPTAEAAGMTLGFRQHLHYSINLPYPFGI